MHLVGKGGGAGGLVQALEGVGSLTDVRVLFFAGSLARPTLEDGLEARGARVDRVEAYRTEPVPLTQPAASALEGAEIVTFTSSSTVTNFLAAVGAEAVPPVVAAIGPVTAATARRHGLTVDVEAEVHTIDGLVDALCRWA
ncbi:MAG: uroporphyrinogen-III synthase, partial [Longimicrobiales bacterium]|nr:uroporphyrinogen-III synthase [Longimicrobiales bacterium]